MKIKIISILIFFSLSISAQDLYVVLHYSIGVPTSNTNKFIDKTSFAGLGIDIRKLIQPDFSVGFFAGWSGFSEEINRQNLQPSEKPIVEEKLMNIIPVFATAHYYFTGNEDFIPFVGLGIGAINFFQSFNDGVSSTESNKWHFGTAPELGFVYLLGKIYGYMNIKYYYGLPAKNEISNQSLSQSYLGINVGIAFVPLSSFLY